MARKKTDVWRGQLRLPNELRRWLEQQAVNNSRSANGEITHRLEQSRRQQQAKEVAA